MTALLALLAIAFVTWRASGKMSYAYLVAGFTLMIVLDGGEQGMSEAIWRTATILLGVSSPLLSPNWCYRCGRAMSGAGCWQARLTAWLRCG